MLYFFFINWTILYMYQIYKLLMTYHRLILTPAVFIDPESTTDSYISYHVTITFGNLVHQDFPVFLYHFHGISVTK